MKPTKRFANSLRRALGLSAGALLLAGAPVTGMAAIVCSSAAVPVPNNADGIYLNLVTGASGASGSAAPGWDINLYNTGASPGALYFFWPSSPANTSGGASTATIYDALSAGATIGPGQTYILNSGSGGAAPFVNWQTAQTGKYLGIRLNNESTSTINYAWLQMDTGANAGFPATINKYCYDNTGASITAGNDGTSGPVAPTVANSFTPPTVAINTNSTATVTLTNSNASAITLSADLNATLASGLVVTAPATTCGGGTASFASGTLKLASGATIPANGSCTLTSTVQSATAGSFALNVAAGALQTSAGNNAAAATASLTVTSGGGGSDLVCSAPINHTVLETINGTYINWISGVFQDNTTLADYHFNPYATSSKFSFYWGSNTKNAGVATTATGTTWSVLQPGDSIGPSSTFSRGTGNAANWITASGVDGYLGFSMDCSALTPAPASGICYGYAHITAGATTGLPANFVDYCYNKAGNAITIAGSAGGPPSVTKSFSPTQVLANADSTATITLTNPNAAAITLTAPLVDTLQSGLVATAATTTCAGGVSFTSGTITLASGATIPPGSCKITATVHAATDNTYVNTIPVGGLQTSAGSNAAAASASLIVSSTLPFPQPYCPVTFPSNVEPITRVALTGIDNPSDATVNGTPALENFLSVAGGALSRTGVYGATVEGNTDGPYTAKIMVYIDWNQNGTFDAGESFALSDLSSSTGTDGKQSTGDITVPADALLGATRMRVIKKFNTVPDACNAAGYGQAEDYTVVVDSNPPPQPSADVTPFSFTMTAEEGASATDTMVVHNTAAGRLTFDIKRALPDSRALPKAIDSLLGKASANTRNIAFNDVAKLRDAGMLDQLRRSAGTKSLGMKGQPIQLAAGQFSQMADNTPESLNGVSCPSGGTSWWRRFYFSEHAGVGASTRISQVTIGTEDGTSRTATVNVYTIPHGVTVDTIPLDQLTLLGTGTGAVGGTLTTSTIELDDPVDIADTSAVDLVVEYNVASSADFYPAGNSTTQTHPTFLSSTTCGIADPEDAANVGAGFPDFHIIMIVDYGDVTPPGTGCGSPSNVAWLSATPKTGTINGIGTKNVTVKANAASLTAGTYGGLMCVNTNDAAHPQFEIPVTFTVTPNIANDTIFKDGFDGAPPVDPDVVTGTINLPVTADGDGSTLDFVTGFYGTYDANRVDDVNLYDYGDGTLTVYWYGDASALSVGGVVDGGGAEFAVLHSGDVIGPSSTILATSKKLANWTTGADGYLGVAFENETTGALNYGYIHLTTTSPLGFPAQVLEYAYNKAGNAITIP
jgi:hypothetical protein